MLKSDLEKDNAELRAKLHTMRNDDQVIRKNISEFLGFTSSLNYVNESKVLEWPQIYNQLGKLIERVEKIGGLERVREDVEVIRTILNRQAAGLSKLDKVLQKQHRGRWVSEDDEPRDVNPNNY